MTDNRSKKTAALIATILVSTIALTLVAVPLANAHDPPWNFPSYAFIVASPNPVGAGQPVSIVMWVDYPLPSASVGNDIRRTGYHLTITKPDGSTDKKDWAVVSDTTSIQYYSYTPDKVGTYTLKFDYDGQTYTWNATSTQATYKGDTYAATTRSTTFVVQEEPLPQPIGSYPLPQEYWTRPIEGQNTDWWSITSNWLGSPQIENRFQPDGTAPNSAHVMWSKPIQFGGVVGGSEVGVEGNTYYMGGSYNVRFSNPLVMYGTLYYQEPYGNSGGGGAYVAVDLRTGDEQWRINTTAGGTPSFGYTYAFDDGNQHGVLPNGLLFTSSFGRAYDPRTGVLTSMNITNVPSGTAVLGPKGEVLRYVWNSTTKMLAQWNSSKLTSSLSSLGPTNWYSGNIPGNTPLNTTALGSTNIYWNGSAWVSNTVRQQQGYSSMTYNTPAFDWNISLNVGSGSWTINRASFGNLLLMTQGNFGGRAGTYYGGDWYGANITAVNLNPSKGSIGSILWTKHFDPAPGNQTRDLAAWDPQAGIFVFEDREKQVHWGYSLADGSYVWGPTAPAEQYDYFRSTTRSAYGNIYFAGYGGVLYCIDIKTGQKKWSYGNGGEGNSTSSGLTTAWGVYPIFMPVIADGKIFLATTEHSPGSPYYKNVRYRAVNATTGEEIWTLMGWGTGMDANYDIVADGFFVFANMYDMQVYVVGKGPSALTVEAPMSAVALGSSLVIRGTVTDIATGTEQKEQAARFPNGVPAVSDESMTGWMEYVYMQKPRPTDVKGVEVTLSVLDANNNFREIGKATSDSNGFYSLQWTPDIPGKYNVYASFAGSESYWPSQGETAFAVDPAPEVPAPVVNPPTPAPMTDTYLLIGVVAIIAAISVVGLLILRKRP